MTTATCPECNEANVIVCHRQDTRFYIVEVLLYFCECMSCGKTGPESETKEEALNHWRVK